jgi:hypothetical protein
VLCSGYTPRKTNTTRHHFVVSADPRIRMADERGLPWFARLAPKRENGVELRRTSSLSIAETADATEWCLVLFVCRRH